ncbi:hypothetical protein M408DRAFT_28310 [Serendipita vermifera MAFF 305830]|uniref:DRBM domain-containing protein n=1 Tax=Serendipita vermifera MAFF 305830 TaxID=933852 RepID=A0A0C2W937_SERVB|nr:hypothetical protein M408DRAFT_28310 [Serendipita vermifera MAFF 305830]
MQHQAPSPPSHLRPTQPLSCRQLLQQRLQKYQWQATFNVYCGGPQHAQLWKVSFYLGSTLVGESSWFSSKGAAKEDAAMHFLEWLDKYGYD